LTTRVPWWQRLFLNLEAKPVLACAYGLMVGGLLVVGMSISRTAEPEETGAPVLANPGFAARPVSVSMTPVPEPGTRPLEDQTDRSSSVTPVVSSGVPSPFFEIPRLKTERASFTVP